MLILDVHLSPVSMRNNYTREISLFKPKFLIIFSIKKYLIESALQISYL